MTCVAAALAGERIAVFGDYDVDGSTSAALLSDFLTALGAAPRVYIPDRMTEGYGPSANAMRTLHGEGASLVITVDCGAAAVAALNEAKALGMDVVVLDHHRVETSPPAIAHVNPNQPGDHSGLGHLCAAGVTFLFLVALNRRLRETGFYEQRGILEPDLRLFLDPGRACHHLRCRAVERPEPRLCPLRSWPDIDLVTPGLAALGGCGRRQGAIHALSSGVRLRSAHQCRWPCGAFVVRGGPADGARRRQGCGVRPTARPAQSRAPGD